MELEKPYFWEHEFIEETDNRRTFTNKHFVAEIVWTPFYLGPFYDQEKVPVVSLTRRRKDGKVLYVSHVGDNISDHNDCSGRKASVYVGLFWRYFGD